MQDSGKNRSGLVQRTGTILYLIFVTCFFGCAGVSPNWKPESQGQLPAQHQIMAVPFYPQIKYQCGPAALASTLQWSGVQISPEVLIPEVLTPSRKGTLQPAMISAARRHGRLAYIISSPPELLKEVASGHPVIVLQNLGFSWFPVWHYALVVGYDLQSGYVVLHTGREAGKTVSLRVFDNTWKRSRYWGMMTLAPTQVPATAEERVYIEAVLGLEKTQQWSAAIEGYRTAIEHWPASLAAHIGLGNSYYARDDFQQAEGVLREASHIFPSEGIVFNNLAQVLWEQGKTTEALRVAKKAVSIGGTMAAVYEKTLHEIKSSLTDE